MNGLSTNSQVNSKSETFPANGIHDESGTQGEQRRSAHDVGRGVETSGVGEAGASSVVVVASVTVAVPDSVVVAVVDAVLDVVVDAARAGW